MVTSIIILLLLVPLLILAYHFGKIIAEMYGMLLQTRDFCRRQEQATQRAVTYINENINKEKEN